MSEQRTLFSYIVAYDSGFAPNPFNDFCTLATCKPEIRKAAKLDDWVVGTGSGRKGVRLGDRLVYAMRVTDTLSFAEYSADSRFARKKPNLHGSYRMACGDNIYYPGNEPGAWQQLNSFHSNPDGTPNPDHIRRDTSVDRVLVSEDFIYFGGEGPEVPPNLRNGDYDLVRKWRGQSKIADSSFIERFERWVCDLGVTGYRGKPWDMLKAARRRR